MPILRSTALAVALLAAAGSSLAHISYTGRNLGTLVTGSNVTIGNQAITSNYGWIDAADSALSFDPNLATMRDLALAAGADVDDIHVGFGVDNLYLGDNHKSRAYRLHLDSALTVTFTAQAKANATAASIGGLLPGFSVYKGLAAAAPFSAPQASADYDFSVASQAWRASFAQTAAGTGFGTGATQGSWNALGDFYIGGDGEPAGSLAVLTHFQYVGHGMDADLDGDASATLLLGPGDYTVFVGGMDLANKGSANAARAFGVSLNVSAVPEPSTWLLLLAGVPLLAARRLRTA
jgi:hypothetical protein